MESIRKKTLLERNKKKLAISYENTNKPGKKKENRNNTI